MPLLDTVAVLAEVVGEVIFVTSLFKFQKISIH
jgi:hypothetical protein